MNWCFEPSQPQRITPGLKQTLIRLPPTPHTSYQTTNSPQTTKSVLTHIYIYNKTHTNVKHKTLEEPVPPVSPLSKKLTRSGHVGTADHYADSSIPDTRRVPKRNGQKQQKRRHHRQSYRSNRKGVTHGQSAETRKAVRNQSLR